MAADSMGVFRSLLLSALLIWTVVPLASHGDTIALIGTGEVSGPIAGNDPAAKQTVAALAEALGYEAVDVGPVRYAHIVEGFYLLRSNTRDMLGDHFEYHLRRRETGVPQEIR